MNIVVAVRCLNEINNIPRFMRGYDFVDTFVISDGGSTDGSVSMLKKYDKVKLVHFKEQETLNGQTWNKDAPHINFVLDAAKELNPDILLFDDMDCSLCALLRKDARNILEAMPKSQINAFRIYMWGNDQYFPDMNNGFSLSWTSLWGWRPKEVDIRADETVRHGTLIGLASDPHSILPPYCLMHKSWNPKTVQKKIDRYNALEIPMLHPLKFAGEPIPLEEWMKE